jgi:AMMECR1 domain-containing protein
MSETTATATENLGKVLIPIARASIFSALGRPHSAAKENLPWLHEKGASFVTLMQNQQLRGCIGTLEAHRPLLIDVKANAQAGCYRNRDFATVGNAAIDVFGREGGFSAITARC